MYTFWSLYKVKKKTQADTIKFKTPQAGYNLYKLMAYWLINKSESFTGLI